MTASQHPAAPVASQVTSQLGDCPAVPQFDGVRALASHLGKTISIFDLETTGLNWAGPSFGIVEVAVIHVPPEGEIERVSSLINPENSCEWRARQKHGISSAETSQADPWGALWAERMHEIAATHVTVGFNSALFDCRAVMAQNYKYRNLTTEFAHHLDFRWLPGIRGRLEQVAARYGVEEIPNHRALADTFVLAKLLDHMVHDLSPEQVASFIEPIKDEGEASAAGEAAIRASLENQARDKDLESLASLVGEDALQEYVSLKAREKQLKQELDALKPVVCAFVREQGGKSSADRCTISYITRPKYKFTEAVDELKARLDNQKKLEIAEGLAQEDGQTEYVTIRWK